MKVFIGYHGEASKEIASILKSWLPTMNPHIETFTEFNYINAETLNAVDNFPPLDCALLCVTPDCARSPWLAYQAGILVGMGAKRLYLILFGASPLSLPAPLLTLGNVRFDKENIHGVIWELNRLCGKDARSDEELERLFEGTYPAAEQMLKTPLKNLRAPEEDWDKTDENLKLEMRVVNRKLDAILSRLPGYS